MNPDFNPRTLYEMKKAILRLPTEIGHKIASKAAVGITALAKTTFDASENAFGDPWEIGHDGRVVTLKKTGRLAAGIQYVAIGTIMRARLGPRYAKYQVGKRPVFPRKDLPKDYLAMLDRITKEVIADHLASIPPTIPRKVA